MMVDKESNVDLAPSTDTSLVSDFLSPQDFFGQWAGAWNQFWFAPTAPHTLAVIRILTGLMTFYTLAVWTIEFSGFIGGDLVGRDYRSLLFASPTEAAWQWSHFDWLPSAFHLPAHYLALFVAVMFTIGWRTRAMGILIALLVISYSNRAAGALFGLDQILAMLTLYLSISNCGDVFSIDAWLRRRHDSIDKREQQQTESALAEQKYARVNNGIATRLIQVHLCIVYLFAGLGKCQGDKWWDGEAVWGALASHEYQTMDMLWISEHMWLVAVLTMIALFWEVSYAALVWPRLTRPIVLAMAVPMHLGIGICLGMLEFGLIMLVANLAFLSPCLFMRRPRKVLA